MCHGCQDDRTYARAWSTPGRSGFSGPAVLTIDGKETGFDIELMRLICGDPGLAPVDYTDADFNEIFDGLGSGSYDAVISGATITPEQVALLLRPLPGVRSGPRRKRRAQPAGQIHRRSNPDYSWDRQQVGEKVRPAVSQVTEADNDR
jgi:hypothetical protein